MNAEQVREMLQPWLDRTMRPAWKPIVRDGDEPLSASKFSGTPWLSTSPPWLSMLEKWPFCCRCGRPMQLFLQLNLDELPSELKGEFGTGLLQLFFCTNDDANCADFRPFEPPTIVRLVSPSGSAPSVQVPEIEGLLPAKTITGWTKQNDYVGFGEASEHGLMSHWDERYNCSLECPELGVMTDYLPDSAYELLPQPEKGDKLAGWPDWIQGVQYPYCPRCAKRMRLVFQIDSEDNLAYMFGDCGCGHITQCPQHKDVVAFGWACS